MQNQEKLLLTFLAKCSRFEAVEAVQATACQSRSKFVLWSSFGPISGPWETGGVMFCVMSWPSRQKTGRTNGLSLKYLPSSLVQQPSNNQASLVSMDGLVLQNWLYLVLSVVNPGTTGTSDVLQANIPRGDITCVKCYFPIPVGSGPSALGTCVFCGSTFVTTDLHVSRTFWTSDSPPCSPVMTVFVLQVRGFSGCRFSPADGRGRWGWCSAHADPLTHPSSSTCLSLCLCLSVCVSQ